MVRLPDCTIVIFGATGDLAAKKLIPALYMLHRRKKFSSATDIIAIGRRAWNDKKLQEHFKGYIGKESFSKKDWSSFSKRLSYHRLEFHDDSAYVLLQSLITKENRIFYLATPQSAFPLITEKLHHSGAAKKDPAKGWHRIVFEKPFGSSLNSAKVLNREITRYFDEDQIYRIDHYVAKSFVQEILVLRFANPMFERLWNKESISDIKIVVSETSGVGERLGYYDDAGAIRDMVQNHLMQLLSLATMEPPKSMSAAHIRDRKVQLLKDVATTKGEQVVVGQYRADSSKSKRLDYRKEVGKMSKTETYAAVKLMIDNDRWRGVPIYLVSGKALQEHYAQIEITFREGDWLRFENSQGLVDRDRLIIRIQPDEGLKMWVNLSDDTSDPTVHPHELDFTHDPLCGLNTVDAYELLIEECIKGDQTLFTRWDFVEQSWKITDRLVKNRGSLHSYPAGSKGPLAGLRLLRGG